jgi:hypothetical protein
LEEQKEALARSEKSLVRQRKRSNLEKVALTLGIIIAIATK